MSAETNQQLADVNVLLALLWPRHVHHAAAQAWFATQGHRSWATNNITQLGAIRLLTLPRICGFVFNPLSVIFVHRPDGGLRAILWEVSNTFGGRHCYLVPVADANGSAIRQRCKKILHVSPFLDMDLTYDFRVTPPEDRTMVSIVCADAAGTLLVAAMHGERRELSDRALLLAFARVPFMTLKVIGAIHWEALRLWLKGVGLRSNPPSPQWPVTYTPAKIPRAQTSDP